MFSTIKTKIIAGLSAIVAIAWFVISFQFKKISKLKHETEIINKKSDIQTEQTEFNKQSTVDESNEINEGANENESKSKLDILNDN